MPENDFSATTIPMAQTSEQLSRTFRWMNFTQFLGALNDNVFKLLCTFALIEIHGAAFASDISAKIGIVFVIPFLFLSPLAGILADRMSKAKIIRQAKWIELLVMILATYAFASETPWLIYLSLFLMAAQSAYFGPSKYGIIPESVAPSALSKANGIVDAATYIAVIMGTAFAPLISYLTKRDFAVSAACCIAISIMGIVTSQRVRDTQARLIYKPVRFDFLLQPFRILWQIRHDSYLTLAVLGAGYFTFIGAFTQLNVIPYGMQELQLSQEHSAWLFMLGALGIGAGSLLAGYLSGRLIELGIIPIGSLMMGLACILLGLPATSLFLTLCAVFLFGLGAGLFIVPVNAFTQFRAPIENRGEIIAASYFFSWIGVLGSAALLWTLSTLGYNGRESFLVLGLASLILISASFIVLPDFFVKFLGSVLTKSMYSIRVEGIEHIPLRGPALLIPNHVSYVDALIISATQTRRVRFIMWEKIYRANIFMKTFCDLMGVIPICPGGGDEKVEQSLREAKRALDEGYLVCIFAEGKLTREGEMNPFKNGFERIVQGTEHPIIPLYLGGLWGSIFSFYHGEVKLRKPLRLPYPVEVKFGAPMESSSKAAEVQIAVRTLAKGVGQEETEDSL